MKVTATEGELESAQVRVPMFTLSSEYGTYKTFRARAWPGLSSKTCCAWLVKCYFKVMVLACVCHLRDGKTLLPVHGLGYQVNPFKVFPLRLEA